MAAALRRLSAILKNCATNVSNASQRCKKTETGVIETGVCFVLGGAVAYYCYDRVGQGRKLGSGQAFAPLVQTVTAKEKTRREVEDEEEHLSVHEERFRLFSTVECEGQLYMTPLNFLEAVTISLPKNKKFCKSISREDLEKMLSSTPPVGKGSPKLFRDIHDKGVITYTEYLFLLCILTKPRNGFKLAFKMFDADGNEIVDKKEFLVLEDIFHKKADRKARREESDTVAQLPVKSKMTNTTLLVHFFGEDGKGTLNFDDFYSFMDNLQAEVLEIEFLSYSKGLPTISVEDFAQVLLRYTTVDNISSYLENVQQNFPDDKGITFEEFRTFFQFLINLEDFAIAMQMYNFVNRPVGQDEFSRAVYVATGLKLSKHLVNTVFKIFDVDHDEQLSYKEFIGIMKGRRQRGSWAHRGDGHFISFKSCMRKQLSSK
ncbi:calcium uptake protein 3, mitochondrial isoform X1 [Alosa sapidissima]|uniref:calcium uptake protein 3, mitochondrial isoform X1 n=2 Tax=Alosa sapidissima TaxID=34773 RepID=UPI001C081303|nr:calcium uptake protein 3, mitochondrial isoform X1 [Alosa sapidissima]